MCISRAGEGYSEQIGWDLTGVRRPQGRRDGARADESTSEFAMPPAPDDLQLGEVIVGAEVRASASVACKIERDATKRFTAQWLVALFSCRSHLPL